MTLPISMVVSKYSKTHLSDTSQEPPETVLQSLCQDKVNEIFKSYHGSQNRTKC